MKRKGFTLIELLAVIVILAIIALISTPTILGVIEKARKGASEQSALGYIDAVEKQVAINQVKDENLIDDGTYEVPMTGITVKGEVPTKGWLKIEKGMVTNYSLVIGKYVVTKGSETVKGDEPEKNTEPPKTYTVYSNGTAIYYNPETNSKCDEGEAVSTTGTKTGCMKWYTFNDEGENTSTVNMILDHNTTALKTWYSSNKNVAYEESNVKPEVDKLVSESGWKISPRLITADEVAKITGNTGFSGTTSKSSSWFCLDTNQSDNTNNCSKSKGTSKYAWLFDYTDNCTSYGCNIADSSTDGYWTSSPMAGSDRVMWFVGYSGSLSDSNSYHCVGCGYSNNGVRPVITISKDILN